MLTVNVRRRRRLARPSSLHWRALVTLALIVPPAVDAQERSVRTKMAALGLDSAVVGRVTAVFAPEDHARARQLSELAEAAGGFVERELGVAFPFKLAVLGPDDWFSPHGAGLPYGIPWCLVVERLIVVPASLEKGALIDGRNTQQDRWRVDFVTLHEFGHLAAKEYLHPASAHEEIPILWFEELIASYFAYAFVSSIDPDGAQSARREWRDRIEGYTPRKRSLDWSFMRDLPPAELALTYGWYQYVLNARAAEIHDTHDVGFLRALKETLAFDAMDMWTTESLLKHLDSIAPGFRRWADTLQPAN